MPVSSSTEHWIKPDALTINLNHFGDPDYLQVSVLAGVVVMAFKQDVIGYNAAHNYRTWPLEAANTYLETTSAVNVYAKLTRSEVNARALIAYDTVLRDIEGREITYAEDGSEVLGDASVDYFFVFLGQISESTDRNGGKKERSWNIGFRFGALNTTEQKNYTGFLFEKMFRPHYDDSLNPDKITSIEVLSGLWTRFFISAKGISPNNGGESGSGLIRQVFGYNDLSGNFLNSDLNNTFNAYTIARLASRILALEQNESGGSGTTDINEILDLIDQKLNGYATEEWVSSTYATKTALSTLSSSVNSLRTDFDNLNALLNDDVTGKINTWHEVVDFLDEYSGSQDLAAILSGMNTDIDSRVEKSKFAEYFNSEMAKWFVMDDANKGIKPVNSYGLYSDTYVSAKGVSTGTGGSGGGSSYDRLDKWSDYTTDKAGWVLSALLGQDLNNRLSSLESGSALSLVTTGDGNAVTAIAKSGNQLTVTKGSTFQPLITSSNKLAYSLISGVPTSLPASDVAAWAKAASKPSYAFSEITNKPTTLGGYGITDAYTATTIDSKLGRYLPLGGGTITSASGDLFAINRTSGNPQIRFESNGNNLGYIGFTSGNAVIRLASSANYYNIIHSGNIGSYKSGSADYISNSAYYYNGNVLTNDISADYLFGTIPTDNRIFPAFMQNHPLFGGQYADVLHYTGYCRWGATQIASEYNAINPRVAIRKYNQTRSDWGDWVEFITSANIGSYALKTDGSNLMTGYVAWNNGSEGNDVEDWNTIRGNGLRIISSKTSTSNAPWTYTTALHIKGRYGFQLASEGGDANKLYYKNISKENNVWKTIAFTDSNVASATKLQTPRTIWGQSFDGTGDVSGKLTGVTQIQNAENKGIYLWSNTYPSNYPTNSGNLGTGVGIGLWSEYGTFIWGTGNGNGHIQVGRSDGTNTSYNLLLQEFGGNVLIGTTADSGAKLQVNYTSLYTGIEVTKENGNEASIGFKSDAGRSVVGIWGSGLNLWNEGLGTALTIPVSSNNVLIGTTEDIGFKFVVNGYSKLASIFLEYTDEINRYGGNLYLQHRGHGGSQGTAITGNIIMCANGGNVLIGTAVDNGARLQVGGSVVASGSVTAKSSSDYRLKCEFDYNVDYQERLLSLGKVCDFNYTPHAQEREFAFADDKRHTSVIWQDARKANITGFCSVEEDGYGTVNPLSSDLIFTMVGAIQQGIVKTEKIEERVVRLEKENRELKEKINLLEGGRYGC